jgi:hypothetical protein
VSRAAICWPYTLDIGPGTHVAAAAAQFRFANPNAGRTVNDLRADVPLFIARAGQDEMPGLNAALDAFVTAALARDLPLTLVNHAGGRHAFDIFDDTDRSHEVIKAVLAFFGSSIHASAHP